MLTTFDFILIAHRDPAFMARLKSAVRSHEGCELCTDIHRLTFDPKAQTISVTPNSPDSLLGCKVIPKKIAYSALMKLLNGDWAHITSEEITDLSD